MITVTINGKEIKLEKPVTILHAARSAGIKIPTLCYHEQLEKYGGCRLCLVEVEKMPRLQTACTLMVSDGMIVRTETEQIADVRRGVLEFLLINHPLDCPYCDKAGECELQDLVEKYGPVKGRFREKKRKLPESLEDPIIVRNMSRCVMCTRCVRMCEGVQGASAIDVIDRGGHSHIEPFSGTKFECEYCGNCLSVCPVGAIMSRLHRHSYRPWQVKEQYETVCAYCGVGCTVVAQVRDDVIKRVVPKLGSAVNNGMLCSRGRFGYEFVGNKERLTTPLIKKNGMLTESTWEEAISLVSKKLGEIKSASGSGSIGGIASLRCTNEDNYIFQKFLRETIGSKNIDTTAATGFAGAQSFIENIFGHGVTANMISDIAKADTVLVIGDDPTTVNPILGLQIRACSRKNGNILTVGNMEGLKNFSTIKLLPMLQTETILLEGIVSALKGSKGLPGSNAPLEAAIKEISISAAEVKEKTGIPEDRFAAFVDLIRNSSALSLVIGKNIVQSRGGSYKLLMLAAIKHLTNGRIYLLSERANEQGAVDMGCSPDSTGLNLFEMIGAAEKGDIKALYIMGENAVCNIPNSGRVEEALRKLEFLVVQDIFLTETARLADVVLPSLSWAEKDGTFTNMERRIQRVRKAVNRAGMEDWRIVSEVSNNMGYNMNYKNASDIFNEIAKVSPLYRNLAYDDIENGNNLYPYKGEPLPVAKNEIKTEKAASPSDIATKMFLKIEKPLFHSGTLSTKAPALLGIYAKAMARMSAEVAKKNSLKEGDVVAIRSGRYTITLPVAIDKDGDSCSVKVSNNFEGNTGFRLTDWSFDPVTKAPCLDNIEITIEKVKA